MRTPLVQGNPIFLLMAKIIDPKILCHDSRHASFSIVPRVMKKARSWRRLESSVGVLGLRKCDKIRNFHRKKVCAPSESERRSAIIKFCLFHAKSYEKN